MNKIKIKALLLALSLIVIIPFQTASYAAEQQPSTQITVNVSENGKVINPELFGAIINWTKNGEGAADPKTGKAYHSFEKMVKQLGITSIRYGGGTISATCFDWKRAIGPMDQRPMNRARDGGPGQPSTFGPDEIGDLLDKTGAKGVMILNINRDDVQSAAQYLAYMTAPVSEHPSSDPNDPSYWAALRAKNGHPKPYDFNWWDVGNEDDLAVATHWRDGKPVEIGAHTTNATNIKSALYAFGGTTLFENQDTIGYADLTPDSSISKGTGNQDFYASYPPVAPKSQTVYVNGAEWKQTDNLKTALPTDEVYTIENKSGKITFGDGIHGKIPAKGSKVTITYKSGPHGGFVDYYKALKAVNPNIKVAAQDGETGFFEAMGSTYPYDGVAYHPLTDGFPKTNLPVDEFTKQLFLAPGFQKTKLGNMQNEIDSYAGKHVPLIPSAYGHGQGNIPKDGDKAFHLNLSDGLLNASELIQYQNLGIPLAHRFLLNDTPFNPDETDAPTARRFNAAIISNGKDDNFVATPSGLSIEMMSKLGGMTQITTEVKNNPKIELAKSASSPNVDTLSTIAAKDNHGNVELLVVNQSPDSDVTTQIVLDQYTHAKKAKVFTMNGSSIYSMNTLDQPNNVTISNSDVNVGKGDFNYTFPAHSITRIELE